MSSDTNARIGIAGLNAQHHARWAARLCSFREIGEELGGIRPQTVAKAFQHRGWRKDNAPAVEPVKPIQPSKPDERLTEPEREKMANIAHKRILMGAMILADKATAGLQAGGSNHSASSLNSYARVLRQAAELLTGLLYPPPLDESESLPELRVRLMTDEEHDELKRKGERSDWDDDLDDDFDDLDGDDPDTNNRLETSTGACISPPSSLGVPASASAEPIPASRPGWSLPLLPDREGFRSWLEQLGISHGRRHVREIATAVSGRDIGAGTDLAHLVEIIHHATGGDPGVLKNMLSAPH
ncbi:hypothetical protein GGE65_008181 [Skermanella aerolata]|uniref:hypothetical protein n=1 Tax=Skermanella aerolata TaxID=393310 RepID=UPI003D24DB1C